MRKKNRMKLILSSVIILLPILFGLVMWDELPDTIVTHWGADGTAVPLGILFILIGNYLPKTTQNRSIGIKIPWTLNNEENWNKTHRFCGKIWVIGGLLMIFAALLPGNAMVAALFGLIAVMTVAPVAYSYWFYRKQWG